MFLTKHLYFSFFSKLSEYTVLNYYKELTLKRVVIIYLKSIIQVVKNVNYLTKGLWR